MNLQDFKAEDFMLNDSFVRYCLQSNGDDVVFWNDWLARNPHKLEETEKAREWVLRMGTRLSPDEKQDEFSKLRALIETNKAIVKRRRSYLPYAAAAAVILCVTFAWLWKSPSSIITAPGTITYTEYKPDSGTRKQVILADGSTVILNRNSILKVPDNYSQQQRHLILEGEALFDVAKDEQRPFTVSAGTVNVEALGTAFKVSAYGFNKGIRVSLISGKVRVNAKEELLPGQSATAVNNTMLRGTFDVVREQDWRNGRLHFKDASLEEMADLLEFWYGIKVRIAPGNYQPIHFNGEFINKPMPEVLASISYITGLKTYISKGELFISH